jgi:hypothetical protein
MFGERLSNPIVPVSVTPPEAGTIKTSQSFLDMVHLLLLVFVWFSQLALRKEATFQIPKQVGWYLLPAASLVLLSQPLIIPVSRLEHNDYVPPALGLGALQEVSPKTLSAISDIAGCQ